MGEEGESQGDSGSQGLSEGGSGLIGKNGDDPEPDYTEDLDQDGDEVEIDSGGSGSKSGGGSENPAKSGKILSDIEDDEEYL